jgi:hypothetical protein
MRDLVKRITRRPTAGDTEHDYRGIPRIYHHSFTRGEITRLLRGCGFRVRERVPLAPLDDRRFGAAPRVADHDVDLTCRGPFRNVKATGWLILAASNLQDSAAPRH